MMFPVQKPYSLYPRRRKKAKPVYYVRFRKPDGTWSSGKCTGMCRKGEAEAWAINYLQCGRVVTRENVTIEEFAKEFFVWGSDWAVDRQVSGKRISERQCNEKMRILNRFIIPAFGKLKLTHLNYALIKSFRNDLYSQGLSGSSINKILSCMKRILEAAEDKSLIRSMPKIERAVNRPKQKGVLTQEEVRRIFSIEWPDYRAYVINLMAFCTGMRRGELLAVQLSQIQDNFIPVARSWDEVAGKLNETTKTGKSRIAPISPKLKSEINRLKLMNPWGRPDSFLFYSSIEGKPMDGKVLHKSFIKALKDIGIDENQRKERNITFHSWRHLFNSMMINNRIPYQKVQSLTGHVTMEMTQHYYHPDDMDDVLDVIENYLFSKTSSEEKSKIMN